MSERSLPFERGETWRGNTGSTTAPTTKLAGRVFTCNDADRAVGEGHGSGAPVQLVILKNTATTAITPSSGRKGQRISQTTGVEGAFCIKGAVTAPGKPGYLLDDAHQLRTKLGVGQNDYVYGVAFGPATGELRSSPGSLVAGITPLAFTTNAQIRAAEAETDAWTIGVSGATLSQSTAQSGDSVLVMVGGHYGHGPLQ
jgi:hypothetical protein